MKEKHILETCYHCGNRGLLQVGCCDQVNYEDYDNGDVVGWYEDMYITLKCPACNEVTLYKRSTNSYSLQENGEFIYESEILYPVIHTNKLGVPKNIVTAFEAAKKVQKIDPAICALSLRRVVELICIDKNAIGNNLVSMVNDLENKNILPKTFNDACEILRIIGNEGAHSINISIPKNELNTLIDFLDSIINYLYVIPEKIKRLKRIKNQKQ